MPTHEPSLNVVHAFLDPETRIGLPLHLERDLEHFSVEMVESGSS